jgi:hypothetical protein
VRKIKLKHPILGYGTIARLLFLTASEAPLSSQILKLVRRNRNGNNGNIVGVIVLEHIQNINTQTFKVRHKK